MRSVNKESKFTMKSIAFDQRVSLFRSVIIDESHKCKSSKTQQGKFVEGICKGKRYVFALTGTPVVNNNTDLIQQLKILGRLEDFGGYSRYVERYCDGPKQASNVKELNWRLWNTCFFRREKSKVLTQLPDKTRQYLTVDITTTKEYKAAEADMVKYLKKYKNASDEQVQKSMNVAVMVQMQLLKQISARGKIKAVCEFVHDVIDGGEKLILFGYLKEVVAELKKEFPKAVTVTGSDNVNQKQYAVDSFQNNPDCKLKPRLTANITIYTLERANILTLPNKALRFIPEPAIMESLGMTVTDPNAEVQPGKRLVWSRQGNTLSPRQITVGTSNNSVTEVTEGLSEGDEVAVDLASAANMPEVGAGAERSPFMPGPPGSNKNKR